ncbi:uncharacterized protein LOC113238181 isoform X2 [Hyposmocoma kahamanoa]|uniref:uncharacterized protein LOC113238181 isoform X2 n=1 Tax=Hyposmocoma kahamanoa TaxID=1477025 RepID=UPI000E6D7AD1|nr:uncharacterized protein LOC113238181 isoform X2 [Hyposmocoma kahamanoa]
MERLIFYIALLMLSHLPTIFASTNESNINRSINKVEKTNKKITFKTNKPENTSAHKVSNDSESTVDIKIDDETTENAKITEKNVDKKKNVAENKRMSADNNVLFKKDHEESLYHPIYSLENLDYYLRHPDKISPNFNPIRSDFLHNNIYNTNSFQSKIVEFLENFKPLSSFALKFPYEFIKILYPKLKGSRDSISPPAHFKKDPIFSESKLSKVIKDFIKRASLLSGAPPSADPLEIFRILSQDIPQRNVPSSNQLNQLQQLSNNVKYNNALFTDRSHDKGHKVFNMQQISFLSSQGQLPQQLFDAIDDFLGNISASQDSKILKSVFNLFERLLNIHPFKNLQSQQIQHSTYSKLFQQQSVAPKSSPSLDDNKNDYLSQTGKQVQHPTYSSVLQQQSVAPKSFPSLDDNDNDYLSQLSNQASFKNTHVFPVIPPRPDNSHDISTSFMENNSKVPGNTENLKVNDDVPKTILSSVKHQVIKIPLLELKTPVTKNVPQTSENLSSNDNILSLIDNVAVLLNDSLAENIQTIGKLFLAGKNSQTEAGKPTKFSSLLDTIPSNQIQTFEFFGHGPSQPGTLTSASKADKSLLSSKDTDSPSKNTVTELPKHNKKPSSVDLISLNTLIFNETKSPGNHRHSVIPEDNPTSDNFSPFESVPNSESSLSKSLNTTVYLDVSLSPFTGINVNNKKSKVPKNKTAQNGQHEINSEEKLAQVGDTKKEKNPDCLKGSTWISKCYKCNCSEDGFPDCNIIPDCVLPPREKPMLCKPYTNFNMGECNLCTCSGDGLPICKFTDCYSHGQDNSEESIQYTTTLRDQNNETKKMSIRNDNTNDVLRSDDSDYDSDGTNYTNRNINRKNKLSFDDEDFDTVNEYGHRRVEKIHSTTIGSQRCEVGSVWEINCFNCFCGLTGRPSCDKMADCSLLPYGKPSRCKPTVVFQNKCGGTCKCDDEGEPWCEDC